MSVHNLFSKEEVVCKSVPILLSEMAVNSFNYDRAIVIVVKDLGAGVWDVTFDKTNMSNSEQLLALDIIKSRILDAVNGKGNNVT